MARGSHPIPFRTRKLSPSAPMVLPLFVGGRVGRCRIKLENPKEESLGFSAFKCIAFLIKRVVFGENPDTAPGFLFTEI